MHQNVEEPILHAESEAIGILIVEDEILTALAASATLAELGYEVIDIAATADDALRAATTRRPDLVLMDITLDGEADGITAATQLRARFDLPVLFVSAHTDHRTMARAAAAKPVGYLFKPYTPQQLGRAVAAARAAMPDRNRVGIA
jgi:CheY-like chemotaxis protein